ncbi:MAG: hypothetical protein ACR2QM_00590, partial [Longimicrobiales bacterium]
MVKRLLLVALSLVCWLGGSIHGRFRARRFARQVKRVRRALVDAESLCTQGRREEAIATVRSLYEELTAVQLQADPVIRIEPLLWLAKQHRAGDDWRLADVVDALVATARSLQLPWDT